MILAEAGGGRCTARAAQQSQDFHHLLVVAAGALMHKSTLAATLDAFGRSSRPRLRLGGAAEGSREHPVESLRSWRASRCARACGSGLIAWRGTCSSPLGRVSDRLYAPGSRRHVPDNCVCACSSESSHLLCLWLPPFSGVFAPRSISLSRALTARSEFVE